MTKPSLSTLARLGIFIVLVIFSLTLSLTLPVNSQGQPTPTAALSGTAKVVTQKGYSGLLAEAQANGKVTVIVGVRVNFTPEGQLSDAAVKTQLATIQQAQSQLQTALSGYQATIKIVYDHLPYIAMSVDAAALQYLVQSPAVTSIEEDFPIYATDDGSTPLIGAPAAWNLGFSGSGQTIAILDSGVDESHPYLPGKVVAEACYAFDCSTYGSIAPGSGGPCTDAVNTPTACQHGTHVAGVAVGDGGQPAGVDFSGVAKDANLISVRVLATNGGNYTDLVAGLNHVISLKNSYKIAAVNMSLGGGPPAYSTSNCDSTNPSLTTAFATLTSDNIAPVVASGNGAASGPGGAYTDGVDFPACISYAIRVGATDNTDAVRPSSQSTAGGGSSPIYMKMLAPGDSITSSIPGGGYAVKSGTSQAAPQIAGAWAVLKQEFPTSSVAQILLKLQSGGIPVTDSRNRTTRSRLQLNNSVNGQTPTLDNDNITGSTGNTAHVISATNIPYSRSQQISGALVSGTDPALPCITTGGSTNYSHSVWYQWTPSTTGEFNVNTFFSTYDTVLGVFQGPSSSLQLLGCSDDTALKTQSSVDFQAVNGTTYFFMIAAKTTNPVAAPAILTLNLSAYQIPNLAIGLGIYQTGSWYLRSFTGSNLAHIYYGASGWIPVYGDWNGDGTTKLGIYNNGSWYLLNSDNTTLYASFNYGAAGWLPVVGKWTAGATHDGIGIYNSGSWYLINNPTVSTSSADVSFYYGGSGWLPVVGKWTAGATQSGMGIYQNGSWYLRNSLSYGTADYSFYYGGAGWTPVVGDWAHSGTSGMGIYQNGAWYLRNSLSFGNADYSVGYGATNWLPLVGDWSAPQIFTRIKNKSATINPTVTPTVLPPTFQPPVRKSAK